MQTPAQRYTTVAITLHWVMAIAILLMLASGFTMEYVDLSKSLKFNLYQWHKSLGVLALLTFFLRIGWRLFHKPPALPASIHGWERKAAHAGHWLLYGLMFFVPLAGWAMVSSSSYGLPTIVFGWFEWPHIPGIAGDEPVHHLAKTAHWVLAWTLAVAILGHVAAIIKHSVIEKENLLSRMSWKGKTS